MIHACPLCGGPAAWDRQNRARPFCSVRCKMVDLGRWLTGSYVIPAEDGDPDEAASHIREALGAHEEETRHEDDAARGRCPHG